MMRDHVVGRAFARVQDAFGNAHRKATVRSSAVSAGISKNTHDHTTQSDIIMPLGTGPLAKSVLRKASTLALSFALALTMMPSAGIAFAATDSWGGGSSSALLTDEDGEAAQDDSSEATDEAGVEENLEKSKTDAETGGNEAAGEQLEDDLGTSGSDVAVPVDGATSDETVLPAGDIINQDVALSTVAQAESTRAYFLAQTLESTKTVPVVSAKLPLDQGANLGTQAGADGGQIAVGSEDKVTDGDLPAASTEAGSGDEAEGGEDSDESDLEGAVTSPGISAESTVVGSFIYRGITYAVEPGGESVAIVAADYSKLPSEFIEAQTIVLPSMVTSDGIDYYTVSRIADYAFSSLTEAAALATSGVAGVDASSDAQAKAEALTYEGESGSDDGSEGEPSDVGAEEESSIGITAITIPASITEIGDDAFSGFGTLQYVIVSEDNPAYGMYDGCLYDADLTSLLLIPEGRTGAVRVASQTVEAKVETFSHHADLSLYVNADSAALTSENGFDTSDVDIVVIDEDAAAERAPLEAAYELNVEAETGEGIDLAALLDLDLSEEATIFAASSRVASGAADATSLSIDQPGDAEVLLAVIEDDVPAYYALHMNIEGDAIVVDEHERTSDPDIEAANVAYAGETAQADGEFVHNRETCAAGGGDLVPGEDGRYYGWTCPHYQDYVAYEYSSTPGTPGYVWVPDGITPSAHISKQAVEAGEYYLIAGGKFANTGAVGSGGMFQASQLRNDYGKPASAWWEITATTQNASLGTLRIHCDYGTTITVSYSDYGLANGGNTDTFNYNYILAKTSKNFWYNASDYPKIRDAVFDHVDATIMRSWFGACRNPSPVESNLETVTFLGNTFPPSATDIGIMFGTCAKLYAFSDNFTFVGANDLVDIRWMFIECGSLVSFPPQFTQPDYLINAWGWTEDCVNLAAFGDDFACTPGLQIGAGSGLGAYGMDYMFGLQNNVYKFGAEAKTVLTNLNKLVSSRRATYYGGSDEWTKTYIVNGKGAAIDNILVPSSAIVWDARGGTFSHSATSSPTGSTWITDWNKSYIEALHPFTANGATVTVSPEFKDTVKVPQSPKKGDLHFLGWYEKVPVGTTPEQMAINEKNCVYRWEKVLDGYDDNDHTIANPGETTFYYALYGEDEFVSDITFDLNTGTGTTPETIKDQTINVAMREPVVNVDDIEKPGYTFDGFWSDKTGGKQYYNADGIASDDIRWTETGAEVTLYAHWKYKVYLDLNTYNTDNEFVLNSNTSVGGAAQSGAKLQITEYLLDTQSGLLSDDDDIIHEENVTVEGVTGAQSIDTKRYYILASFGAPLQLPQVVDRTGYSATCAWGLEVPEAGKRDGTASRIIAKQSDDCYLANDTELAAAYADMVKDNPDYDAAADEGITLYADWSDRANTYWVQLRSDYSTTKLPADTFSTSANGIQYVQVTYDQPVNVAAIQKPVDDTTATNDVTGITEPRNLRHSGFRTQPNSLKTSDGVEYVAVGSDGSFTVPTVGSRTVKFRETNDGKTGAATATATPPGASEQTVIVLYGKWLNPEATVTIDLQGGTLNGSTDNPKITLVTNEPIRNLGEFSSGYTQLPERKGYQFTGYWTSRYTETEGATETIDGTPVEVKKYYEPIVTANGSRVAGVHNPDDTRYYRDWTSYKTADTLYAHWQYKIYLNLNTVNTDGETVLNAAHTMADGSGGWMSQQGAFFKDETFATEQKGRTTQPDNSNGTTGPVQGLNENATLRTDRYYYTTIAGAPIGLPLVEGRIGYADTRGWGATAAAFGAATDLISNVDPTTGVAPDDSLITKAYDALCANDANASYDKGITLFANWRGVDPAKDAANYDGLSGYPRTYTVELWAAYTHSVTQDVFKVTDAATMDRQRVEVTFDAPIDFSRLTMPQDASIDATTQAPRNLDLRGFFTRECTVEPDGSAGKVYLKVSDGAFNVEGAGSTPANPKTIKFRETTDMPRYNDEGLWVSNTDAFVVNNAVVLYAWWTYATEGIVFDLQGGDLGAGVDADAFVIEGVRSHGDVPRITEAGLSASYEALPVRDGYRFAGYWNTPYREKGIDTDAHNANLVPDADTPARCYYVWDEAAKAVVPNPEMSTWLEYQKTTLYAHWEYDISFDKNLTYADIATIDYTAVDESSTDDAGIARVSASVPVAQADQELTDAYGNAITVVEDNASSDENAKRTVRIRAIAGAPVLLPLAHTRLAYDDDDATKTYDIKTGYYPTREFYTQKNGEVLSNHVSYVALDNGAEHYTTATESWGDDGLPCALGKTSVPVNAVLELHAQWTPMTFYVQLMSDYVTDDATLAQGIAYDDADYTATGNPVVRVTYDGRLDAAEFVSDYTGPIKRFTDYRGSGARALVGEESADGEEDAREVHENLDFYGFWTEQNDFRDNSQATVRGTMYLNANGVSADTALNGTSCKQNFRFLTAAVANAELAENSKDRPYKVYALWGEPTRGVTFNYFDADAAADSTTSDTPGTMPGSAQPIFTLQKGDVLADEVDALSAELATVTANVTGANRVPERANYRFAGFWTTTYSEDEPELIDGVEVEPVRYFDLNEARTALVATQENWGEDAPTTLYAHWKYKIRFEVNGQSPENEDDLLRIGTMSDDDAASAVMFSDTAFTDGEGYVVFGQPLTLPFDNDTAVSEGKLSVKRLRSHGDAGIQQTGYVFRAWLKDAADEGSTVPVFANDTEVPKTFAPDAGNVVHLYGQWTADTYTIQLLNTYDGFAYNDQNVTVNERGTVSLPIAETATVAFDQPLTERITPPSLYGYVFKGYFTGKNGVNADGTTTPYYGPGDPALNGLSAPSDQPWREHSSEYTGDGTQKIGYLYAWYDRIGYEVRFVTRDMADGTLQTVTGSVSPESATWHYGDDLTAANVFPEPTFTRSGYTFDGWYYYEDDRDGTGAVDHTDSSARTYVYRYDAEGAGGAGLGGMYVTVDGASWSYEGSSWPHEYGMTLYAGWTPNEYEITFYSNYPHKQTASDTLKVTYEQVIDFATDLSTVTGEPLFSGALLASGAPYEFLGWNTSSSAGETAAGGWLLGYDSLTETHRMVLDDDGTLQGGRFMPQGASASANAFTYHAIWKTPADKEIYLFGGAHGSFKNATDAAAGYHLIDDFSFDFGSSFASDELIPQEDAGWVFKGYMLVPASEVPDDGVITAAVTAAINGKERGEGNLTYAGAYPKNPPDLLNNYLRDFQDYYLVATYALEGDYSVTLDLGSPQVYEGATVSVEGDLYGTLPVQTSPTTRFRYDFKTEYPVYSGDGLTVIGYEKTPDFHLPLAAEATAKGYVLSGWYVKQPGDPDGFDYAAAGRTKLDPGTVLSPAKIAADAADKGAPTDLVYVAAWEEKAYTVVFDTLRYANAVDENGELVWRDVLSGAERRQTPVMTDEALDGEKEVREGVSYHSTITLPYPATRGGGMAFDIWSLSDNVAGQHVTYGGSFAPEQECSVSQLVEDIEAGKYRGVTLEDDTITFYAHWLSTVSATMPIQVLVAVDPDSGDVLAAPAYVGSRWNDELEVVSLRYDQLLDDGSASVEGSAAPGAKAVFGLTPGESAQGNAAYLTVYAGLETGDAVNASELLRSENVGAQGELSEEMRALLKSYSSPLLIDLNGAQSQVFPKTDPLASGGSAIQTLDAKGFKTFGYWETDALPIVYGLWFDGAWTDGSGNAMTPGAFFRDVKRTLPATTDSGVSYPIAKLYYTVAKA